ncbi:Uncharacterised protein [Raoultella terrigena]|uniref:Acetyltransferase n=1 Tax=Raoultella terrigena TaxID=577 RepID=A0A3P8KX76_RAOTE|nr:Uncharacterised protein [Raoultella terrigena]
MNIFQAQPQDVDKILPLYLGYRNFYQVEAQPAQAREFILKRLELNESVIFSRKLTASPPASRSSIRCSAH